MGEDGELGGDVEGQGLAEMVEMVKELWGQKQFDEDVLLEYLL